MRSRVAGGVLAVFSVVLLALGMISAGRDLYLFSHNRDVETAFQLLHGMNPWAPAWMAAFVVWIAPFFLSIFTARIAVDNWRHN